MMAGIYTLERFNRAARFARLVAEDHSYQAHQSYLEAFRFQ